MTGQGNGPFLVTAARLSVACSTDWPPDKKTTPARSDGTWFFNTSAVRWPTSSGVDLVSYFLPARTMFVLRMQAARSTFSSANF